MRFECILSVYDFTQWTAGLRVLGYLTKISTADITGSHVIHKLTGNDGGDVTELYIRKPEGNHKNINQDVCIRTLYLLNASHILYHSPNLPRSVPQVYRSNFNILHIRCNVNYVF
jgi:hypothetical protein